MAKVVAVCTSTEKGTKKVVIAEGRLKEGYGLLDDAHADCCTHRQVSLLATESIKKMLDAGFNVGPGDFAENLTTEGIDLVSLPVGTNITVGDEIVLKVSQIGKKCHSGCAIFVETGKCIMPKEGIFATVVRGGRVRAEDAIKVLEEEG